MDIVAGELAAVALLSALHSKRAILAAQLAFFSLRLVYLEISQLYKLRYCKWHNYLESRFAETFSSCLVAGSIILACAWLGAVPLS